MKIENNYSGILLVIMVFISLWIYPIFKYYTGTIDYWSYGGSRGKTVTIEFDLVSKNPFNYLTFYQFQLLGYIYGAYIGVTGGGENSQIIFNYEIK